ncbi:hypothetical protein EDE15_2425 [Edaphobacter aggregans]|uniref:Uncharacterized protein n=1 Tax=Edaphobacter aggregans TaxID=570835 RepID=A0A3R9QA37_9BACT|nr:HNH endonuclease [Edaphobacter aggregans]RSL16898.1 hypothetical protein EDE15_2425 [Edaphobacter aggregans]
MSGCAHKQPPVAPPLTASLPLQIQAQSVPLAQPACPVEIKIKDDQALAVFNVPNDGSCKPHQKKGHLLPDPKCTPGAVNSTLTVTVLKDPDFRTDCVRNKATSADEKAKTYGWYSQSKPQDNQGQNQTCELDHLVPLYLGGADTLDNIWPQCGPDGAALNARYFKEKDKVELYLGEQVRNGTMSLKKAQVGIAKDWTQYIAAAEAFCKSGQCGKNPNVMGMTETDDW